MLDFSSDHKFIASYLRIINSSTSDMDRVVAYIYAEINLQFLSIFKGLSTHAGDRKGNNGVTQILF